MEGEGFPLPSGNVLLSSTSEYSLKRNYCDGDAAIKDELGNLKQPEAQHPNKLFSDLTTPYTYTETSSLSSCRISQENDDIFEPFPLNPPPTLTDQRSRLEALEEFLDLATSQNPAASRDQQQKSKEDAPPTKSSVDEDEEKEMKSPPPVETTSDNGSQNTNQLAIESIANIMNMDYRMLPKIRDYQEIQWENHFMDLVEFHKREGHCCVPNKYEENPGLARWVKRQRYQYKLRLQGVPKSTMVPHRLKALEKLGFVWDTHSAQWEEQLGDLKVFRTMFGHCNVPSIFPANPQLSTWVKRQRRLYREWHMPQSRQDKLNELGFEWKTP